MKLIPGMYCWKDIKCSKEEVELYFMYEITISIEMHKNKNENFLEYICVNIKGKKNIAMGISNSHLTKQKKKMKFC